MRPCRGRQPRQIGGRRGSGGPAPRPSRQSLPFDAFAAAFAAAAIRGRRVALVRGGRVGLTPAAVGAARELLPPALATAAAHGALRAKIITMAAAAAAASAALVVAVAAARGRLGVPAPPAGRGVPAGAQRGQPP